MGGGIPGRPPKPTHLKALAGNPGKRELNTNEPTPPAGIPDPPEWLSPMALAEWERLMPILVDMGVMTLADGNALAFYAESYATYVAAVRELAESGPLVESYRGGMAKNPAAQVARDALEQLAKWGPSSACPPRTGPVCRSARRPNPRTT
ncbi:phage terminase small subunit P27 family [Yinghuangia aomiensis]